MAKIESRLPFLHARHGNRPKAYPGQISKYIIQDGLESKFSDYNPDTLPKSQLVKLSPPKVMSSTDIVDGQTVSTMKQPNDKSNPKKQSTGMNVGSKAAFGLKNTVNQLKKPSSTSKSAPVSSPVPKFAMTKSTSAPVSEKNSASSMISKLKHSKTDTTISLDKPNPNLKPSLFTVSKTKLSKISSAKKIKEARPVSQPVPTPTSTSSTTSRLLSPTDYCGDQKPENNESIQSTKSGSKPKHDVNKPGGGEKRKVFQSRLSPPKQFSNNKQPFGSKCSNNYHATTPNNIPGSCTTVSKVSKPASPSNNFANAGLKTRAGNTCKRSLDPQHFGDKPLHRPLVTTLCEPLLQALSTGAVKVQHSHVSIHHAVQMEMECKPTRTNICYSNMVTHCVQLELATEMTRVSYESVKPSVTVNSYSECEQTKIQTLHAPLPVMSACNDVYRASPLAVCAEERQCYTFLQHSKPSPYRKQLVNSFAVKEELSPTAENSARHIATSMPQPWLSADILGNYNSSHLELIIPEPPPNDLKSLAQTKRLQSIEEDNEICEDVNVVNNDRSFSSPLNMSANESINKLVSVSKQSKPMTKSSSILENIFSKIGGKRILSRPQESPPRVRKACVKTNERLRRKPSPRLQRKNTKHLRSTVLPEKLQLKQKHPVQDDSPIRCKEAYYGGDHQHMFKPIEHSQSWQGHPSSPPYSAPPPCLFNQGSTPEQHETAGCRQTYPRGVYASDRNCNLSQGTTSVLDVPKMCRDGHMKIYAPDSYKVKMKESVSGNKCDYNSTQNTFAVMSKSSTSRKSRKNSDGEDNYRYQTVTHFSPILAMGLPPCPPVAQSPVDQGNSALSKVSVAVRLKQSEENMSHSNSYISVNTERGQLVLQDPSNQSNMAPSCRRQLAAVPKFFAFDTVFSSHSMQMDVCRGTVVDVLRSVLQGSDGCVMSFGQSKTGKSYSLVGVDSSCADFGVIPTAISWLYQLIEERKTKTSTRFSVRITCLEIRGHNEELTDLLASCSSDGQDGKLPEQIQLTNTPVYGAQLENLQELRAPDAAKAGFYLDAALTARHNLNEKSDSKGSHFLFTLHVYQHYVEMKPSAGGALVAGGRSRLHFIDIGQCAKSSSSGSALTLAALGSSITAVLNGQRHFPHKDSKLATLLKDSVGQANCKTCILVHISTQPSHYTDTLQILQLAARIHRMKVRRKNKASSNSSDDTGSANSSIRQRCGIRMGTSASLSDPDVSSSEQSVDTVIYNPINKHRHTHLPTAAQKTHKSHVKTHSQGEDYSKLASHSQASPYNKPGTIKKMLSDEETSSEGRRRMPRTNARAWPKVEPCEQEVGNHLEHWQDASRDQWHSPGYSNPLPLPHNPPLPHSYHPQLVDNHPPHYHPHLDTFSNDFYHIVQPDQSSHWISLAQYNGNPEQIGHMTRKASTRSAWAEPPSERRGAKPTIAEVSKQELWVDGPTAFRKNIEGLTSNLKKEQLSPAKRQHRHHSNGERSDKPKNHHHRTPSRKHRDTTKHCHQCGADIKKESKADVTQKAEGSKSAGKPSPKSVQELNVIVKPFVKDWVMRHSKNNTPTKESEAMDQHMEGIPADLQSKANDLYETELDEQDGMQLTVELGLYTEGETTGTSDPPLTDLSCNYSEDANQDGVQIDDSVSNVTADEKVGFESKDESSYDETSLSEEIVEVCDAACQTEFTDSDSHSLQSNTPLADSELPPSPESVLDTTPVVIARYSHTKDSTEAFLNATLQGSMLRKPDGASDPSLHKELLSPQVEYIDTVPRLHAKCYSNTLPRNAYLSCPGSIAVGAPAVTLNDQPEKGTVQTVKLQPYLSSSRQNSVPHDLESSSLSNHSLSPKSATKTSGGRLMAPESPPIKQESKLKKPTLFKQTSGELTQNGDCKLSTSSPDKKSRTSKLPGLRLSSKPKDGKTGGSTPVTPTKKSESSKKEKKSLLQPPSSWKSSHKANSKLSAPSVVSAKSNGSVDMNSSPYRHYVLPKPSYSHSDGCSDNSSCLSHSIAQHKYSVSSGYDSMTLNSAEGVSQTMDIQANMQSTDPWRSSTLRIESSHCEELDKIHQHRHEENKLSQEAMRHVQIQKLLYRQDQLKKEMAEAKSRLMIPAQTWNYELHVALQVDRRNDDGYLEALEKETSILQKRVDACKSRIMLVTSIL